MLDRADELEPAVVALVCSGSPAWLITASRPPMPVARADDPLAQQRQMSDLDDRRPRGLAASRAGSARPAQPAPRHRRGTARFAACYRAALGRSSGRSAELGPARRQHHRRGPAAGGRPQPLGLRLRDRQAEPCAAERGDLGAPSSPGRQCRATPRRCPGAATRCPAGAVRPSSSRRWPDSSCPASRVSSARASGSACCTSSTTIMTPLPASASSIASSTPAWPGRCRPVHQGGEVGQPDPGGGRAQPVRQQGGRHPGRIPARCAITGTSSSSAASAASADLP